MKIIIPQNYAQIRTNSLSGSIRMSVYYSSPLCWLCCPLTDGDHSNIHSSTAICMATQPASQLLPTVIHSFIHLINRAFMENPNRLLNSLFTVLHDRDLDFRGPVRHFLFFSSSPLKHLNVQTKVTADQIRSDQIIKLIFISDSRVILCGIALQTPIIIISALSIVIVWSSQGLGV